MDKWKEVADSVTMNHLFEFCEVNEISEQQIYKFYGIDYQKLSDARDELVASL